MAGLAEDAKKIGVCLFVVHSLDDAFVYVLDAAHRLLRLLVLFYVDCGHVSIDDVYEAGLAEDAKKTGACLQGWKLISGGSTS